MALTPIDAWSELSEQSEGWSMKGYYQTITTQLGENSLFIDA